MKFKGIIVAILIALAISCFASADQPVPAVPETQGLVTTTGADVVGMATETDAGAWTLTNNGEPMLIYTLTSGITPVFWKTLINPSAATAQLLAAGGSITIAPYSGGMMDMMPVSTISIPQSLLGSTGDIPGNPSITWSMINTAFVSGGYSLTTTQGGIHAGALYPGQVQYTTAYDASIIGQAGHTVLNKGVNINTGNKVLTQSNFNAATGLTYIATAEGGNVVGVENLLIDGAGNTTQASDRMLCPFASLPVNVIPAYCNIVQTGNSYDLTVGSVTSTMSDRFVGTDATIPVQLDHEFNVKPYGTTDGAIPAIGSTSAYIKVHIQEARGWNNVTVSEPLYPDYMFNVPGTPLKAEDLQYSESSSASGVIQQFSKVIHYQSGKSLMP